MSRGTNFKNGYLCVECNRDGESGSIESPIYVRVKGKFKFMGLVLCRIHGTTRAIAVKEVKI